MTEGKRGNEDEEDEQEEGGGGGGMPSEKGWKAMRYFLGPPSMSKMSSVHLSSCPKSELATGKGSSIKNEKPDFA